MFVTNINNTLIVKWPSLRAKKWKFFVSKEKKFYKIGYRVLNFSPWPSSCSKLLKQSVTYMECLWSIPGRFGSNFDSEFEIDFENCFCTICFRFLISWKRGRHFQDMLHFWGNVFLVQLFLLKKLHCHIIG